MQKPIQDIPTITHRKLCLPSQTISYFHISVTCLKLFHLVVLCVLREIWQDILMWMESFKITSYISLKGNDDDNNFILWIFSLLGKKKATNQNKSWLRCSQCVWVWFWNCIGGWISSLTADVYPSTWSKPSQR